MRGAALPFCALPAPRDTAILCVCGVSVCARDTRAQGHSHIDVQGTGGKLYCAIKPSRVSSKGPDVIYPLSSTREWGRPATCTVGARLTGFGGGEGEDAVPTGTEPKDAGTQRRGHRNRSGHRGAALPVLPRILCLPPPPTAAPPSRSFAGHRSAAAVASLCVSFPVAEIGLGWKLGRAAGDTPCLRALRLDRAAQGVPRALGTDSPSSSIPCAACLPAAALSALF